MNTPRPRLSRLAPSPTARPANGNGQVPKLRMRPQPEAATPGGSGARRVLAPLPLAGIALIILALILDLGVLAANSKRTPVLLATHALPAGTVLSASDVRTGQLDGEASVLAALIPSRESRQVIGQRLSSAVPGGAPVPAGALASGQSSSSALVLSTPEFDVIGAKLQPGDRVTVLATFGAGSGQATTRAVARNLEVLSVGEAGANADPSTTTVPVTVAVETASLASSLALANEDAKLDLLLEGSGGSSAAIPPANQRSLP
jgi:Flp pilus assembly protein CpaB